MRTAPLKGDCVICQAPDPTRVAINAAIWPGEAMIRHANYRQQAVDVARGSEVPALAALNVKTVARHVEHVEASWREVPAGGALRAGEAPLKTDFLSLVDQGSKLSATAMAALQNVLETNPDMMAALMTKEVVSMAKLGLTAAAAGENSRLKRNQQAIDVMAIFAAGSGHVSPMSVDDGDEVPIEVLRAAMSEERRQLAERTE